jgi:hypothetical protein
MCSIKRIASKIQMRRPPNLVPMSFQAALLVYPALSHLLKSLDGFRDAERWHEKADPALLSVLEQFFGKRTLMERYVEKPVSLDSDRDGDSAISKTGARRPILPVFGECCSPSDIVSQIRKSRMVSADFIVLSELLQPTPSGVKQCAFANYARRREVRGGKELFGRQRGPCSGEIALPVHGGGFGFDEN